MKVKLKIKVLSVILAVSLVFGLAPWTGMTASADGWVEVSTWSGLYDALQNDNSIRLTADVSYGQGGGTYESQNLNIPDSKTVTIDLNGHTIDRGLANSSAVNNGYVI